MGSVRIGTLWSLPGNAGRLSAVCEKAETRIYKGDQKVSESVSQRPEEEEESHALEEDSCLHLTTYILK